MPKGPTFLYCTRRGLPSLLIYFTQMRTPNPDASTAIINVPTSAPYPFTIHFNRRVFRITDALETIIAIAAHSG